MIIIKDEILTANREHRCSFCGAPIRKGERYKKITYDDGGIDCSKYHLRCNAAIEKYNEDDEVDMVQVMDSVNGELTDNGITPAYHVYEAISQWDELQHTKHKQTNK